MAIETNNTSNDVLTMFKTTPGLDRNTSYPGNVTDDVKLAFITTTQRVLPYSPRAIYIRGHLLHHPSPDKSIFNPIKSSPGVLRAPNSIQRSKVRNFDEEPDGANSRKKRKHILSRDRIHDYNMLYDALKVCFITHCCVAY
jgi:hypothetical protein